MYDLLLTNLLFQELVAAKGRDLNDPSIPSLSLQSGRSYAVTVGFLPLEDLEESVGLGPLPILIHQGPGDVQYPGRGPLGREMGKLMRETRVPRAVKVADLETLLSAENDWPVVTLNQPLQWPIPEDLGKLINCPYLLYKVNKMSKCQQRTLN